MPPQNQPPAPTPNVPPAAPQPGFPPPAQSRLKNKKWLIVAGAAALLLVLGAAVWWFLKPEPKLDPNDARQTADTANVRKVAWVEPANLPAKYVKSDESDSITKTFYYDDKATNCFIVTDIAPYGTYSDYGKTPKEVVLDLEGTIEEGITIAKEETGPGFTFKDVDGKREYRFDSVQLTKDVNVEDLDHTKEYTISAYKPFGVYSVSLGMTCKAETWEAQKSVLEDLAKQFTLRTER